MSQNRPGHSSYVIPDEIVGERILLRPRSPENDLAVWQAIQRSREHLAPWMAWLQNYNSLEDCRQAGRRALARWILREDLAVVILERETERFLGCSGLVRIDWSIPCFEIGYWLCRSAVGQGFATETVRLLMRAAFETLGAKRVFMEIKAHNHKSISVAKRAGFLLDGTLRSASRDPAGNMCDEMIYALTDSDYETCKPLQN